MRRMATAVAMCGLALVCSAASREAGLEFVPERIFQIQIKNGALQGDPRILTLRPEERVVDISPASKQLLG